MLSNKNVLLGVCGSIAAYKSATLARLLVKAGANVRVVMTPASKDFISPLTLATLTGNAVLFEYSDQRSGTWNNHVELGLWADLILIAPATANSLAKFTHGLCDNLLSAVYLSARCPVLLAPAMDVDMWRHPAVRANISALKTYGNVVIEPAHGELASGLTGQGRMQEPEDIVGFLNEFLKKNTRLQGKRALVTAGPTYEAIDPVRFIGNHSSGKMGFAIAKELASMGAEVTLVTGPTALEMDSSVVNTIRVQSAEEMFSACSGYFNDADIAVFSAAVADYRAEFVSSTKLKKQDDTVNLRLVPTTDILSALSQKKKAGQLLVGFALETDNEEANAIEKLKRKNLDLIILNSLNDEGAGFKSDTNKVTIIDKNLVITPFELKSKQQVASDICQKIVELI